MLRVSYVCVCVCLLWVHVRSEDNFQESVFSLHRVFEGVNQAIRKISGITTLTY